MNVNGALLILLTDGAHASNSDLMLFIEQQIIADTDAERCIRIMSWKCF